MSASMNRCTQAGPPTYVGGVVCAHRSTRDEYAGAATLPGICFTLATVLNSCSDRRLSRK